MAVSASRAAGWALILPRGSLYQLSSQICVQHQPRAYISTTRPSPDRYKLLIVGGGSGGCAIASKFVSQLGKDAVAVLEPSERHYYQPYWTLVGGGQKAFKDSMRPVSEVIPKGAHWIHDSVSAFQPEENALTTKRGKKINYEYLVIAMGVKTQYQSITGALEALAEDPMVVSNYHPVYVQKTFPAIQAFSGGAAIFTFPDGPIKCAGAPQKIAYLAEYHFRKDNKRDKADIYYNTALPVIFGIPRYAEVLNEVVKSRGIKVNHRHNLIEVNHKKKEAVFKHLDTGEMVTFQYSLLHIAPPCRPPSPLQASSLVDETKFLDLNRETLQHTEYKNVFGIGDCTNLPTAKTAAGVASQSGILQRTIKQVIAGKSPDSKYNGYTSCPLITAPGRCILAEFGYDGSILETFPINQARERWSMYKMKAEIIPWIYWNMLVKGKWNGPGAYRKFLRFGRA